MCKICLRKHDIVEEDSVFLPDLVLFIDDLVLLDRLLINSLHISIHYNGLVSYPDLSHVKNSLKGGTTRQVSLALVIPVSAVATLV